MNTPSLTHSLSEISYIDLFSYGWYLNEDSEIGLMLKLDGSNNSLKLSVEQRLHQHKQDQRNQNFEESKGQSQYSKIWILPQAKLREIIDRRKFKLNKANQVKFDKVLKSRVITIEKSLEFYRLYGPKLINYEFGEVEMFNYQFEEIYPMEGYSNFLRVENIEKEKQFVRWGKVFNMEAVSLKNPNLPINQHLEAFIFYIQLLRERLFSMRYSTIYKDRGCRERFPYPIYICDLNDTVDFSLNYLTNLQNLKEGSEAKNYSLNNTVTSHIMARVSHLFKKFKIDALKMSMDSYETLILPFQYLTFQGETITNINIFLVELKQKNSKKLTLQIQTFSQELPDLQLIILDYLRLWLHCDTDKLEILEIKKCSETKTLHQNILEIIKYLEKNILQSTALDLDQLSTYLKQKSYNYNLPDNLLFENPQQHKEFQDYFTKFLNGLI